jgi:hypothetical protein
MSYLRTIKLVQKCLIHTLIELIILWEYLRGSLPTVRENLNGE